MAALDVVTGALGYSGAHIARRLLGAGRRVRTLTGSPGRPNPFGAAVEVRGLAFDRPGELVESLRGVDTLYNTYWVRFNHRDFTFAQAVANTRVLFAAAREAGVRRIVHVSITNPSRDSALGYFRGKAELEEALMGLGVPYAILRPAVLFGGADILINNMAFLLRRVPVFAVFGDGEYRLQPIHVDDLATLAVACGAGTENEVINAIGPETFTYRELVGVLGEIVGRPRRIISVPPAVGFMVSKIAGWFLRDVVVTRDEIKGLMAGLLYVDGPAPAQATTRLTAWAREHAGELGIRYASELGRRRDRVRAYDAGGTKVQR